jgi:AraC-like DNA-binding protein
LLNGSDIIYAKRWKKLWFIIAISLHVISGIGLALIQYYGLSGLGYFASGAAILFIDFRPAGRAYDYFAPQLTNIVKPVQPHQLNLRVRNQLNLIRYVEKSLPASDSNENNLDRNDEIANTFLNLVKTCFADAELNSEDMAKKLNITKKQLERKVKQVLGITPKQCLIEHQLRQAKALLSQGEKVSKVFEVCGFSSHAYFSNKFREKYGCPPSDFASLERLE